MAVMDESRAQVLIAEGKLKAAEEVARYAVRVLDKSGHQFLLGRRIDTHGIALTRRGRIEQGHSLCKELLMQPVKLDALNQAPNGGAHFDRRVGRGRDGDFILCF